MISINKGDNEPPDFGQRESPDFERRCDGRVVPNLMPSLPPGHKRWTIDPEAVPLARPIAGCLNLPADFCSLTGGKIINGHQGVPDE